MDFVGAGGSTSVEMVYQNRPHTYNVTLRRVRATIVAMEKQ